MDVVIEAAPMVAEAEAVAPVVRVITTTVEYKVIGLTESVASFPRSLSIAGTSISAVSPDYDFIGGTAEAA